MSAATVQPATPGAANILVVAGGDSPELAVLERLPKGARCAGGFQPLLGWGWCGLVGYRGVAADDAFKGAGATRTAKKLTSLRAFLPRPPTTKRTSRVVAIGQTAAELDARGLDWGSVDVVLNCGVGKNAGKRDDIRVRCSG
jgi:hypothetical protein